ncbi:type II toxin-antitoxin system VapC family toxin [Candidatus Neomicrothrix sp.]|uniref:type II toxin-antitoxin system VapC family toxin n=1 Tax=Candidatus Neomicrothrix sp. TaxID=2719034 RepID=UPI0025949FDA|nr:type II toxin-antitoxin system VapC family toxin [Candidatus Microthrix sp.]HMS46908.1 type II toxin-antitoxin system VapC family toxin [Candidatus Microthrix sp.]
MAHLLLDSHVVRWWLDDHPLLGTQTREQISASPEVLVSVVTPWELGIERALGKLSFPDGLVDEVKANGFEMLGISSSHAEAAPNLPPHHRDPFDRMLVAQCQCDSLTLVTADRRLHLYDVDLADARL